MIFATDFDGVLCDFPNYLRKRVYEIAKYDIGDKYYFNIPGYTNEEIAELVESILDETERIPPIKKNIAYLIKISKFLDQPVLIVTSRKSKFKRVTENWLERYVAPYLDYEVRYAENVYNKADHLDDDTLYFVDDFVESIRNMVPKLRIAFLINAPYNKYYTIPDNVVIVKDMSDVYNMIKADITNVRKLMASINESYSDYVDRYLDSLFELYSEDAVSGVGAAGGGSGSGVVSSGSGSVNSTGSLSSYETFTSPILRNVYGRYNNRRKSKKSRLSRIKKEEINRYYK